MLVARRALVEKLWLVTGISRFGRHRARLLVGLVHPDQVILRLAPVDKHVDGRSDEPPRGLRLEGTARDVFE